MVVAAVTFEAMEFAKLYQEETKWPWPLLVDRNREAYEAFGMTRGSRWRVLGPQLWLGYLKLLTKRWWAVHRPHDDIYQLGGDVIIDPEGRVAYLHLSQTPLDRPTIDELLHAVDQCRSTTPDTAS